MGEKVYKPILDDGSHLLRSSDNPSRVRGLSRDENNKNPGIPEWEEIDLDELKYAEFPVSSNPVETNQLTKEQQEFAYFLAAVAVEVAIRGGKWVYRKAIKPCWDKHGYPWLLQQKEKAVEWIHSKIPNRKSTPTPSAETMVDPYCSVNDVSSQIDNILDQMFFELTEEEYNEHFMKLVYHMLGVVNEIRILSNARLREKCATDDIYIQRQQATELFLSERVATKLNQLLSDKRLLLDLDTSRELFSLTGGGVWLNNEYIPVQTAKIQTAIEAMAISDENT